MIRVITALTAACLTFSPSMAAAAEREFLTLDENVWVTFYDLPSRRFRNIRDRFVQQDFDSAARDIDVSIAFLDVETERASDSLQGAMREVQARLGYLRDNVSSSVVVADDFDATFARAHWLLTQHYLLMAQDARDAGQNRPAGQYLAATAHHLERAVLWSNARIDEETVGTLETLRDSAATLISGEKPDSAWETQPVRLAARTVVRVGEHLDRVVRIREEIAAEL